jgi:hypothetical protein
MVQDFVRFGGGGGVTFVKCYNVKFRLGTAWQLGAVPNSTGFISQPPLFFWDEPPYLFWEERLEE